MKKYINLCPFRYHVENGGKILLFFNIKNIIKYELIIFDKKTKEYIANTNNIDIDNNILQIEITPKEFNKNNYYLSILYDENNNILLEKLDKKEIKYNNFLYGLYSIFF